MKNIIKRIFIGVAIGLILMFARSKVYAYEWTTDGDEQISTVGYGIPFSRYYNSSSGSGTTYPKIITGSSYGSPFSTSSESGTGYNNDTSFNYVHGPYYVIAYKQDLTGITFENGKYYYVIIPLAYKSAMFTNNATNLNESVVLDSSSYTSNSENIVIDSASFSSGVVNDLEVNSNYPYYLYFKINFHATDDVDDLILYINGDSTSSITYTAFNTTSFDDYLFTFNNQCTSVKSSCYNPVSQRTYKPFVYSHIPGSIYPDANDTIQSTTDDIKDKINEIINGQFSEDLNFPSINNGTSIYGDNQYSIQDIILWPLEFLQTIVDNQDECIGPTIPLPGWLNEHSFTLPCATNFLSTFLPSTLIYLIKNIFGVVIGFYIVTNLYNEIQRVMDPDELAVIDAWWF